MIPVFLGTNCEYDTANACLRAGIEPKILVVRNLTTDLLTQSAQELEEAITGAQMIILPGGFSGGDEPRARASSSPPSSATSASRTRSTTCSRTGTA